MQTTKEKTSLQLQAEEQVIKDKLFETFFIQRDLPMVYGFLDELSRASIFSLAKEDDPLDPWAVEFLFDLKETVMTFALMTGETKEIGNFKHQQILQRFLENSKNIAKDKKAS